MYLRLFAFIKNEDHIIRDWLEYHGQIFPWWSIHIYDNKSTDNTYKILCDYKAKYGINVYQTNNFKHKGNIISSKISGYKNQSSICFPLDADEFITLYQDGIICKDPSTIKEYIISLPEHGEIFNTKGWLSACPERELYNQPVRQIDKFKWELTDRSCCKRFFRSSTFISTDLGFHTGKSVNNNIVDTEICYLHYHDTGKSRRIRRCEEIITAHDIDINTIKERIAPRGTVPNFVESSFNGVSRVNEYINQNNWLYDTVTDHDIHLDEPLL